MIDSLIKLEYILAFSSLILPGFIIMKIIKLKVPNKDFLLKDMLFEALSYSLLNLALLGWIPYLLYDYEFKIMAFIAFILLLTLSPVLMALFYVNIISSKWFRNHFDIQMPTAWDWYFSQRPNIFVLVKLKNGSEIIGYFGENSYATSYPNDGALYLEAVYRKGNDDNLELINNNNGILISKDTFDTIEFIEITSGEKNE